MKVAVTEAVAMQWRITEPFHRLDAHSALSVTHVAISWSSALHAVVVLSK